MFTQEEVNQSAAAAEIPQPAPTLPPEAVIEQLRAMRAQIGEVNELTPAQRRALAVRARASVPVLQASIDVIGAQEIVSQARDELAPALVLAPSPEVCRTMGDKYLAHAFFVANGIPSPRTWLPEEVPGDARYPLLVKIREGFGSRHIYRSDDAAQLAFHLRATPVDSMVQEHCLGEEFSIDVFCDTEGRCLNAIPRSMIQSKGGESIKGESLQDRELIEHGARVAETIGIVGPANVQCFREPDGSLPVTDVNPRFGGAFPLPLAAGSRYPELALALARGESPEPRLGEFRAGVVMTRFFSDLCLVEGPDGELVPFAEELPEPIAAEPGQV